MPASVDVDSETMEDTRLLRESGNSVVVSIPPEILDTAGLETGDTVTVSAPFEGGQINVKETTGDDEK
jgi:antitoxin component of MazEF toxin-antitoxin module